MHFRHGHSALKRLFSSKKFNMEDLGPLRVRFAPSPTGFLHLGGLRTALFNYLAARKSGGQFILRIEDTDRTRTVPGAIDSLIQTHSNGQDWIMMKDHLRLDQTISGLTFKKFAEQLIESGHAYRCFCSKDRLALTKTSSLSTGKYDRLCTRIRLVESQARIHEPHVIRFKIPNNNFNNPSNVILDDIVYGRISTALQQLDDVVLMKTDGFPTYHFANIIDDHLMQINLVMRGQEWIASTPLHLLLYKAFNWEAPKFAHLPLLINPDGSKLSKRQNDAFVSHYIQNGYLPEALVNFIAYLGWTPAVGSAEIFDLRELAGLFDLGRLNCADATVNFEKLKWINRQHLIRNSSDQVKMTEYVSKMRGLVSNSGDFTDEYLSRVIKLMMDRVHFIEDIPRLCGYFFTDPAYEDSQDLIQALLKKTCNTSLNKIIDDIVSLPEITSQSLDNFKKQHPDLSSSIFNMLVRTAVTGTKVGAAVLDTVDVIGSESCKQRFINFKAYLKSSSLKEAVQT